MSFENLLSKKLRTIEKLKKGKANNLITDYYKQSPAWLQEKLELIFYFQQDDFQKFLSFVDSTIKNKQSVFIAIQGKQGCGKTVSQYYLKDVLGFSKSEIIYTIDQLDELRDNFPERTFIMFPDMSMLFTSRNWDKEIQSFTNTLRAFENVYCLSIPYFEELDKAFRLQFEISEMLNIFDRRILTIRTAGMIYKIVIPNIRQEVIDKIHEKDVLYKKIQIKNVKKNKKSKK